MSIILHCDMDAFYCQVEQVRLNISPETALAVQQWHSLIATNYPARSSSVDRHSTASQAKIQCPSIRLVHVPTYRLGETEWKYRESNPRQECKVSLQSYRSASHRVFSILRQFGGICEKASIDEAYIELTPSTADLQSLSVHDDFKECVVAGEGENPLDTEIEQNLLRFGVKTARAIRERIMSELGYTISIGISFTKSTSKILSAMHKPDKVFVLV